MSSRRQPSSKRGPRWLEHGISVLNAWIGDHLARTGNELEVAMAFYEDNRPVTPEAMLTSQSGKACVLVHGLGCNESLWTFPAPEVCGGYGELLRERGDFEPLYLRYNTGLRISENGKQLAAILERYAKSHGDKLQELVLIGHSMGGLVLRSACHHAEQAGHCWLRHVTHVFYLGSPHLGAPLEKLTHVASHVLGLFDTTATQSIREVLATRSAGVQDLRFGNLVEQDWLDCDPDALLQDRRVPIPWLSTAHHHRIVGQLSGALAVLGDAVVRPESASASTHGSHAGTPDAGDVIRLQGLGHLALAHHALVYQEIEARVIDHG